LSEQSRQPRVRRKPTATKEDTDMSATQRIEELQNEVERLRQRVRVLSTALTDITVQKAAQGRNGKKS
jgi:hypothetical protein